MGPYRAVVHNRWGQSRALWSASRMRSNRPRRSLELASLSYHDEVVARDMEARVIPSICSDLAHVGHERVESFVVCNQGHRLPGRVDVARPEGDADDLLVDDVQLWDHRLSTIGVIRIRRVVVAWAHRYAVRI